jgi:hypothetical protein
MVTSAVAAAVSPAKTGVHPSARPAGPRAAGRRGSAALAATRALADRVSAGAVLAGAVSAGEVSSGRESGSRESAGWLLAGGPAGGRVDRPRDVGGIVHGPEPARGDAGRAAWLSPARASVGSVGG